MRITLRNATHLASSLLLAAGLGVFSGSVSASAQNSTARKSAHSSTHKTSHGKRTSAKRGKRRERGQQVPTSDRISEIQRALAKDGSYTGAPSGKWDDSTQEALRKFQESHGLSATGNLDAKSLQQLGLGSSVAGVAPPAPSATPSKLTSSTAQTSPHRN